MDLSRLDYHELAVRYDLGSLKEGGDLELDADGDLARSVDGDLKLGNDQHNALHRLVVRWQMEADFLASLFESILGSEHEKRRYGQMVEALLSRKSLDEETAQEFAELQQTIGAHERGPGTYAGAIAVALNNLLRREWVDLGKPNSWETAGEKIAGYSFGRVIEAAANNFRHADEWAQNPVPTPQQLESISVIASVLGTPLAPNGARHPFGTNVCPKILLLLSDGGNFERLMDRLFGFARSLAGL